MTRSVPEAVERRLTSEPLAAYLATSVDDRPHVAPLWYQYDDGVVELTTKGRKLDNIRDNPNVSLAVQKASAGIPEWMVTLLGTATVVDDEAEEKRVRREINRKYGVDPDAYPENTLVTVSVGSASLTEY